MDMGSQKVLCMVVRLVRIIMQTSSDIVCIDNGTSLMLFI